MLEAGAHNGQLTYDLLSWFEEKHPDLLSRLDYWILEPSSQRRGWQQQFLRGKFASVRWADDWAALAPEGVHGIIFSNELLDAFPVIRIGWNAAAQTWFEWCVTWAGDRFFWTRWPTLSTTVSEEICRAGWHNLPAALAALLPDGFTVDLCPTASAWWSQAARALVRGKLLTLDYGFTADEMLLPQRHLGSLRSYRSHRLIADPLGDPGAQDLTSHVNFSALVDAGESAGLKTEFFKAQSDFLTRIAAEIVKDPARFGTWDRKEVSQFHTLTHPDHLGHAFRVLVQSR
jgi:SAM-dependent MidA family methyltransferase